MVTKTTSIPKEHWMVHVTHCYKNHGCKYGAVDCPVVLNLIFQKYSCDSNNEEDPCHSVKYYFKELLNSLTIHNNIKNYPDCTFFFKGEELYFIYNSATNMIYPRRKVTDIMKQYFLDATDRDSLIKNGMQIKFMDIIIQSFKAPTGTKLSVGTATDGTIQLLESIVRKNIELNSLTKTK